jgi:predicted enzyme related to lactoylglutathione lyase
MKSALRKFVLAVHLTFSVGWIGTVIAYLALGVTAVTAEDVQTIPDVGRIVHRQDNQGTPFSLYEPANEG